MSVFQSSKGFRVLASFLVCALVFPLLAPVAMAGERLGKAQVRWLEAELNEEGNLRIAQALYQANEARADRIEVYLQYFIHALRKEVGRVKIGSFDLNQADEALVLQLKAKLFGFSATMPPAQAHLIDASATKLFHTNRKLDFGIPASLEQSFSFSPLFYRIEWPTAPVRMPLEQVATQNALGP